MISNSNSEITIYTPQIKICGITNADEAKTCAALGADAIGFIFYPKSPRYVNPDQAIKIRAALPQHIMTVGVFVDESIDTIMDIVWMCRLDAIQLHGNESPQYVEKLIPKRIPIIKALYMKGEPPVENAFLYNATAYLVECEKGSLPGGNALTWKWEEAADFGEHFPVILAGGLSPDNVAAAVTAATPDAVDVSSGVEISPGRKDLHKVEKFIQNVKGCKLDKKLRRIFHGSNQ